MEALGEVLRAQGNLTSAEACLREGLEKLEGCRGPKDPEIGGSLVNLASLLDQLNRPAPRSPHTPDAIGSVFYAAMCGFAGLRGVFLTCSLVFFRAGCD